VLALQDPNDNHISVHTRGHQPNSAVHSHEVDKGTTTAIPPLSGRVTNITIESTPEHFYVFVADHSGPSLNISGLLIDQLIELDQYGAVPVFFFSSITNVVVVVVVVVVVEMRNETNRHGSDFQRRQVRHRASCTTCSSGTTSSSVVPHLATMRFTINPAVLLLARVASFMCRYVL
jgi:hypothetical protein